MYVTDQSPFLNAALSAETGLGPLPLLQLLKATERTVGRTESPRYGPREIDIDLIAYGCATYRFVFQGEIVLQVPHPRVVERRFVLQPVHDVAPGAVLPGLGAVNELLSKTIDQENDVLRLEDAVLPIHGPG
jgi:2-amino-4-hydroxy-6-hydroxymethyldihydropteridine diphosphokinase